MSSQKQHAGALRASEQRVIQQQLEVINWPAVSIIDD
jgi:hypothetical protein